MAVNQSVYPDKYKFWSDLDKTYELFTVGDTFYTEQYKKLPFGQLWDNSNVYTTFDPTNTNLWFGVDSSKITFEPINDNLGSEEKPIHYIRGEKNFSEPRQVNLRLAFSPTVRSGTVYGNLIYNWGKITEEIIQSGYSFNNPYGLYYYSNLNMKTSLSGLISNNYDGLNNANYMLVNDIKRENLFLGIAIGLKEINDNSLVVYEDTANNYYTYIRLEDDDFSDFLPGGKNFDKRVIERNGKKYRIAGLEVFLYVRENTHDENESFRLYVNNYRTDSTGGNMAAISGDGYYVNGFKLRIISELKIEDNIYYMNIDNFMTTYAYSLFFYRNNYLSSSLFYNESYTGYAYGYSNRYFMYRGQTDGEFNVSDLFFPISSTFEYDLSEPSTYDEVDFLKLINSGDLDNLDSVNKLIINVSGNSTKYLSMQKPFISVKDVFHLVSSFLIPFTIIDGSKSSTNSITSRVSKNNTPNAYVGIRKEDGHVDGTWIPYEWGKTDVEHDFRPEEYEPIDPDYKPPEPVTPDDDGDINIGSVPVGITNAFTNCYIMNTGAVDYAGKILWSGLGSQQAESGLTFGGMVKNFFGLFTDIKSETTDSTYRELALNTILDYFVSLRYYPIQNLFSYTQATVTDHLSVGTGQEPIVMAATGGFGVPQKRIVQMSGGQLTRAELNASGKVYNSFLDYQPNTTATLYIPYCGTVELTPSQLLDCDTIDIVYALDIMTGALSAIAMKNGTASYPIAMLQGTCGFETLVSGSNKGIVELATSISNLRFGANTSNQIVQGLANSAIGSASQNAENAEVNTQAMLIRGIASAYNAGTSMYNYLVGLPTMTGVSPISAGSMSSLASTIMPQTAYIQLTKHSADIPTNFENTYGRTTNVYGSIGSYQGYLICGNPRLEGIPCTEHERDEIFSLLTTGVYVE